MEKEVHKKEAGFARLVLSRWRMKLYMLSKLPLGLVAGLRVDRYDAGGGIGIGTVSLHYKKPVSVSIFCTIEYGS